MDDKINMLYDVIIGKEKLKDVSKRYHRTMGYISNLVTRIKKNKDLLHSIIDKRDQNLMKEQVV